MRPSQGFTLIEIVIAVAILVVVLLMAVPSLNGVLADRKLRASLDQFHALVRQAQERSVNEHRPYLIVWGRSDVSVQPERFAKDEEKAPVATMALDHGTVLTLSLPGRDLENGGGMDLLADRHMRTRQGPL